jgi:hypothetical protein
MKISPLVNLDFEQIKLQLKYFLKNNTKFTDYDYEGSNVNQLLDVLSYVTFLNAYNTNIGLNELNLQTAVLRDTVTSKAQELGYTPNNYKSASINVNLTITVPPTAAFVEIPAGVSFVGTRQNDNLAYTFNTINRQIVSTEGGLVNTSIVVKEGILIENTYVYGIEEADRIIISNDKIDLDTITVVANGKEYKRYDNLNNYDYTFYTSVIQDNNIEIEFGRTIFGKAPNIGETVTVSYLVNHGSLANGVKNLTFTGEYKYYTNSNVLGTLVPIQNITFTNSVSDGGTDTETLAEIKFKATKLFIAQNRAVVGSDYQSIILNNFPYVGSVQVMGGEDLTPPQYGKIKLTIQTKNGLKLNNIQKNNIKDTLKRYNITTIPIITDSNYVNLKIRSYIKYNPKKLPKNVDKLIQSITKIINDYVGTELKTEFYGHKLESLIYKADESIESVKIKLVTVEEQTSNTGNFSSTGNDIKNDNCNLYSLLSKSYIDNGEFYRISSLGDNSLIQTQKYNFDTNSGEWVNDAVVGQINPNTGDYTYNLTGVNQITVVSIPETLDLVGDSVLVPIIFTPVISDKDISINYNITTEPELANPTKKPNTTAISSVSINDIIPIISNINC